MNIFSLLPSYLVVLAIVLVIIPTIVGIIMRFFLWKHLTDCAKQTKHLLEGRNIDRKPQMIKKIEQRFYGLENNIEEVNTSAIVSGEYSEEKCKILGVASNCEFVAYFTRLLPNLLLSFGLLGTFLGITINLTNLSQTITQVDITDVRSLVGELNQPLQGMGVAFITSLIAIACSSLLTVLNLLWNTNIAKAKLITFLEDYSDNFCLAGLQTVNPLETAIENFTNSCDRMLSNLGHSIESAIGNAFSRIEQSADTFDKAANTLDRSRLPEQLSNATSDLAIAQNNFSQSSLVLQRSTKSFEHSIEGINKVMHQLGNLNEQVHQINNQYDKLVEVNRQQKSVKQSELKNIQEQLEQLTQITKENNH